MNTETDPMALAFFHCLGNTDGRSRSEPSHVTVEHRHAPTTDQIRLLREIEKCVTDSIIARIPLDPNHLHGEIVLTRSEHDWSKLCRYRININGRIVEGSLRLQDDSLKAKTTKRETLDAIVSHIASTLAIEIVRPSLSSVIKQLA